MQPSPFYERLRQRYLQEGMRKYAIENTLAVLNARFPHHDVNAVKIALEAMQNFERLKQLNLNASLTPDFEAFLRALEA